MQKSEFAKEIRALAENLLGTIKKQGGFSPAQIQSASLLGEESRRAGILRALADGPKTGHEVIQLIQSSAPHSLRVSPSSVYPLLESLADQGLLKLKFDKDRKTYSLTKTGRAALDALDPEMLDSKDPQESANLWLGPKWVDFRGNVVASSTRLAKVALEVSQYGSKEQQDAAALAIDEARRKINAILAEK